MIISAGGLTGAWVTSIRAAMRGSITFGEAMAICRSANRYHGILEITNETMVREDGAIKLRPWGDGIKVEEAIKEGKT